MCAADDAQFKIVPLTAAARHRRPLTDEAAPEALDARSNTDPGSHTRRAFKRRIINWDKDISLHFTSFAQACASYPFMWEFLLYVASHQTLLKLGKI